MEGRLNSKKRGASNRKQGNAVSSRQVAVGRG